MTLDEFKSWFDSFADEVQDNKNKYTREEIIEKVMEKLKETHDGLQNNGRHPQRSVD